MYQQSFILVNPYEVDCNPIMSMGWVKCIVEENKNETRKVDTRHSNSVSDCEHGHTDGRSKEATKTTT
jgi:hypothetical protein